MARSPDETSRLGIHAVAAILTAMRWAFREQTTSDFGIDAQAEKLGDDGAPTGQLIAIQIKSGASWFRRRGNDYVFYGNERHKAYWTKHALPVFIVLHNPDTQLTLWQRVERQLIEEGDDGRWSIAVPATNTLDARNEHYILAGIATDDASVRRHRLALDLPLIRQFAEHEYVYLRLEKWVNKTLNFRETEVVFGADPDANAELKLDTRLPASSLDQFMAVMFPWLDYELVEYDEDCGAGEIATHVLEVSLSKIGHAMLTLEDFYEDGPPDSETYGGEFGSEGSGEDNDEGSGEY